MLSKKMSVVAGPLAHLAFPGVALAIVYHFSFALGVFPFVIFGAILIWFLEKKTKLPMENLTAVIFAFGVGTSLLFLPIDQAEEALVGNIMKISGWETAMVTVLSVLVYLSVKRIYKKMILININEEIAIAKKINVSFYNLVYLLSIAVVVALGVYLVGGLITVALIAIPAGASRNISRSLPEYKFWAVVIGAVGTVLGILFSQAWGLPAGPTIIVIEAIIFSMSLVFKLSQK
jgi:ABC-type Mn2+/Zn2+ transport system permease subunit